MTEECFLQAAMAMRSKLYHVARAILWNDQDAADAMQDAMLRGWKYRWTLRSDSQFEAWFMRILVNRCRDLQRRQMRDRNLLEEMLRREELHRDKEEKGDAWDALMALPEAQRLPALLYYYDGYSQKDIAKILGLTGEQVKARIRTARDKMRKMLSEGDEKHG